MINILKGFIIATSLLVPGVSGATMMMTLNVYTPALEFLTGLTQGKLVYKKMMLHLFGGALLGLVGFSFVMQYLVTHFGKWIGYFFLGSILYGLWIMIKQIPFDRLKKHHFFYLIIGILIAVSLESLEATKLISESPNLALILLGGIGIAVALILPGISTSFVLLTLGLYEPVLEALSTFNFGFIGLLLVGVLVGCLLTAKLLIYLLNTHPVGTIILICGFIIGSLWEVFPGWPQTDKIWLMILLILSGIGLMVALERLSFHFDEKQ